MGGTSMVFCYLARFVWLNFSITFTIATCASYRKPTSKRLNVDDVHTSTMERGIVATLHLSDWVSMLPSDGSERPKLSAPAFLNARVLLWRGLPFGQRIASVPIHLNLNARLR